MPASKTLVKRGTQSQFEVDCDHNLSGTNWLILGLLWFLFVLVMGAIMGSHW